MLSRLILFYLWATLAFATFTLAEEGGTATQAPKPSTMLGLYHQDISYSAEEMDKYMEAMGFKNESRKMIRDDKHLILQVRQVNGTHWMIQKITQKKAWGFIFQSGEEFDATLLDGRVVKSTVSVNSLRHNIHRVFKMEGFDATSDYIFTEKGVSLTLKARGAKVELKFHRIPEQGISQW